MKDSRYFIICIKKKPTYCSCSTSRQSFFLCYRSKFFTLHRNEEREQVTPPARTYTISHCTPNIVNDATGLKTCAHLSLPKHHANAPNWPLHGPMSAQLFITNSDVPEGYVFRASWNKQEGQGMVYIDFFQAHLYANCVHIY